ncbi:efflux RND transporter permease subunit [Desulfocurvus vexinensis]|uniref:efflux RND transporter permease subunit n=1 Tax=Desulfocurvus vexinensis TaxID=399548 RepID=UPI000490988F|nr:efflux RND transporter permease subunit [Desulfocurvus vexinensis]
MIVNRAALARKSAVLVLTVFLALAGAVAYRSLPLESNPDVTIPYVFVTTDYEGVAPEDMEKLVTIPLERKLKGLSDLEELRSISQDGASIIALKFLPDIDIDDALQKVRDKVDQAKSDLPADLPDDPVIAEMNFSDRPIINVVLSGPFSLKRLKVLAESFEDRFEAVPGVLDASVLGGLEREIHVLFDLDRVAFYRMPFSSLLTAVTEGNVNVPGGSMDIGDQRYQVRVPEDFQHPDEIRSLVAFTRGGRPVYLRDVASIEDAAKDQETIARMDGQQSVTVSVTKRSGENVVQIVEALRAAVQELRGEMPPALTVTLTSDQSEDIKSMFADLENNIISGLVLVLAVVLLFIGGRSALFVSLSIPLSMLITFAVLQALGITLNMVVLFALILALGMLVDNGIVVVENVYRHMQEGADRAQAAQAGTDEVAWPVIASTLTTLGAFVPMMFWPGIMGQFMSYLPLTVMVALSASLFVALVVNPVLSARFQTVRAATAASRPQDRALEWLQRRYLALLARALDHRLAVAGLAVVLLVASVGAFVAFGRGVEFMPSSDPERAWVHIETPVGTSLEASDRIVRQAEALCLAEPDVLHVITQVGTMGGNPFGSSNAGTHVSKLTVEFKDFHERSRPSTALVDDLRAALAAAITGATVRVEKETMGPPTGEPVNMEIQGTDMQALGEVVALVMERIKGVPGLVDLQSDYIQGKPEIRVAVDKEKAALMGLTASTVAQTVKAAVGGTKVGSYREGKDEYDIVAKLPRKDRSSLEGLTRLTVSGTDGEPIPLTSLATVEMAGGIGGIKHIDQKRVVTVSADVSGRTTGQVLADVEAIMRTVELPRGFSYSFTGEKQDQQEASDFLGKAFVAALFLIFLVLVTQFDGFRAPLIILASVGLSLIGVFAGLLLTGMSFSVIMTGVGVISLAGVVVNNAIVLIDYFNQLRARGLAVREALMQAGATRFRPVLLTAVTTILGLLPMATGVSFDFLSFSWDVGSESAQWWGPMAVAVVFGLLVATLLTLVVVPVLCSLAEEGLWRRAEGGGA